MVPLLVKNMHLSALSVLQGHTASMAYVWLVAERVGLMAAQTHASLALEDSIV